MVESSGGAKGNIYKLQHIYGIYTVYIYIYIYYIWLATVQPMRYNIIAINNVGTDTHKKHKHRKLGASGKGREMMEGGGKQFLGNWGTQNSR